MEIFDFFNNMCILSRYLKIIIKKILKNYKLLRIIKYFDYFENLT